MQEISFVVDGRKLSGAIFYPDQLKDKNPAILVVHGWTGKKLNSYQYAEALAKLGFICFLFDMRGHGTSEGDIKTFTIREFLDDVIAAYDYLLELDKVDKDNVSAVGSSFGGYMVALLSEKRTIKNLSMRAPADYPNENFDQLAYSASASVNPDAVNWRSEERSSHDTYALEAISNFNGNIQIIESENDTLVPHQTLQNYIDVASHVNKLTHTVIKDAPHSIKDGPFKDQVEKILVDWFKDKI